MIDHAGQTEDARIAAITDCTLIKDVANRRNRKSILMKIQHIQPRSSVIDWTIFLALMAVIVFATGCTPNIEAPLSRAKQSITDAKTKAETISGLSAQVQPVEIGNQIGELAGGIGKDLTIASSEIDKATSAAGKLTTENQKWKDSILGGRGRLLVWGGGITLAIILAVFSFSGHNVISIGSWIIGLILGLFPRKKA